MENILLAAFGPPLYLTGNLSQSATKLRFFVNAYLAPKPTTGPNQEVFALTSPSEYWMELRA